MKVKISISTLLTALFIAGIALAAVGVTVSPTTLEFITQNQIRNLTITNGEDMANITISSPGTVSDGITTLSFTLSQNEFLDVGPNEQVVLMVSIVGNPQDLKFGQYDTSPLIITATNESQDTATQNVNLKTISSFCSNGAVGGNLSIKNVDIDNRDGDDDEWEPLNVIEVEVEVENTGNGEIEDVVIEFGLFESDGSDIADDLDWESDDEEEVEVGDIDDGDEEEITFRFRVPPDIEDKNYKLAIKVYSDDLGEGVECADTSNDLSNNFFELINIDRESDEDKFVVVDDIIMDIEAACGERVTGTFTVFNIGDDDQERVRITMTNDDLGLDQEFEITSDLDEGDDERISFTFVVPENLEERSYPIEFRTFYDYKKEVYRWKNLYLFLL